MSFDHSIALFSAVIAFRSLIIGIGGFVTVIVQLRDAAGQRESDSQMESTRSKMETSTTGLSEGQDIFKCRLRSKQRVVLIATDILALILSAKRSYLGALSIVKGPQFSD